MIYWRYDCYYAFCISLKCINTRIDLRTYLRQIIIIVWLKFFKRYLMIYSKLVVYYDFVIGFLTMNYNSIKHTLYRT